MISSILEQQDIAVFTAKYPNSEYKVKIKFPAIYYVKTRDSFM